MTAYEKIKVGDALPSRDHTAGIVQLFMYNAAIWNPHRIHFDHAYATQEEGYPGIVLDGPLQGDWIGQVVTDWIGDDATLVSFGYANRRAAFLGETMTAGGQVEEKDDSKREVKVSLFLKNAEGEVTIPGHAVVRFR
jgi:3-methylfumaryl-CoA hydratase